MRYSDDERRELLKKFELYRLENNLGIVDAGKLVGVAASTVMRWEDGKQLPHKGQCYNISKVIQNFVPTIEK